MPKQVSPGSRRPEFDVEAYLAESTRRARESAKAARRRERGPCVEIGVATFLSLLWTPAVIIATYGMQWDHFPPSLDPVGIRQANTWPWILGSLVLTAYSAFYGCAARLATRTREESYRAALGAYYGFWVWLPMLLMYPGTERLGIGSDPHVATLILVGIGQTIYVWSVGRWSRRYLDVSVSVG
jgi:hypothetical protein